jgi:hypothetical protein
VNILFILKLPVISKNNRIINATGPIKNKKIKGFVVGGFAESTFRLGIFSLVDCSILLKKAP